MFWTIDQQNVIHARDCNLLVSAAAGSGKTAVLVERIIQRILDPNNPIDVDALLVITFTEAAATEMKERIAAALEEALQRDPDHAHLQKQNGLVHQANISTIHAFCLSVIREHFYAIQLDPSFRTMDDGEARLLRQDVVNQLLEEMYAKPENQDFLAVVDRFTTARRDTKLEEMILRLHRYSMSYPRPEEWLRKCAQIYDVRQDTDESQEILQQLYHILKTYLKDGMDLLQHARSIAELPDGPYMYGELIDFEINLLETALKSKDMNTLLLRIREIDFATLPRKKDESVAKEKREHAQKVRNKVKEMIKKVKGDFLYDTTEQMMKDIEESYPIVSQIAELVMEFNRRFEEEKRSRNVIDFSDMEHLTLRILTEVKEGQVFPSEIAKEYQHKFVEVMVDEYQDSNYTLEQLIQVISKQSQNQWNTFMVGDVKQSIYAFRLSRPELFMEKYKQYSTEDCDKKRITLRKNFRSRQEVLDTTNYIFYQIMREEVGGITYDEDAALYLGADYQEDVELDEQQSVEKEAAILSITQERSDNTQKGCKKNDTELLLCDASAESEVKSIIYRIQELMKTQRVWDKSQSTYRAIHYQDIVILLRSTAGFGEQLSKALIEAGIPAHINSREGYFNAYEIKIILNYLKLIDNEKQDIPLTSILTSLFVGCSQDELALIRITYPTMAFHEAVRQFAQNPQSTEANAICLQNKLKAFFQELSLYRDKLAYLGLYELLRTIIMDRGYDLYIQAMPGGDIRKANLDLLLHRAIRFESSMYRGVFHFLRYIEDLEYYSLDEGEASILDEHANTVRIMTIHKSKGLEFPVVLLAGMSKSFNLRDTSADILIHDRYGLGINLVDPIRRTTSTTIPRELMKDSILREGLGEELRVLYVALTRAKEKLIMIGQCKDASKAMEEAIQNRMDENHLTYFEITSARNYLQWILPVLANAPETLSNQIYYVPGERLNQYTLIQSQADRLARSVIEHWDDTQVYHEQLRNQIQQQMYYEYPYPRHEQVKRKLSVSELKKREQLLDEEELEQDVSRYQPDLDFIKTHDASIIPRFIEKEKVHRGAFRGSAYHRFLELLDFSKEHNIDSLYEEMDRFLTQRKMTEEMITSIRVHDILHFLSTPVGVRLKKAACSGTLREEQPFVLAIDSNRIYPDIKDEKILIQGIIDVWFEEEKEIVLLDYKTDQVKSAKELLKLYRSQLDYYAEALEQLTDMKVKERLIYSFALKETIICE